MMKIKQESLNLVITPEEAWIIDSSLKGIDMDFSNYYDLLLRVGQAIVQDRTVTVSLSPEELWFLRSAILMDSSVGRATGDNLLKRIYTLLGRYYSVVAPIIVLNLEIKEEVDANDNDANQEADEGPVEDPEENTGAGSGTEPETEPRSVVPWTEG